jgi:hypothetical protein
MIGGIVAKVAGVKISTIRSALRRKSTGSLPRVSRLNSECVTRVGFSHHVPGASSA